MYFMSISKSYEFKWLCSDHTRLISTELISIVQHKLQLIKYYLKQPMDFFNICNDTCVKPRITPRNSHINQKNQSSYQKFRQQSFGSFKQSLSQRNKHYENSQESQGMQTSKKSLKRKLKKPNPVKRVSEFYPVTQYPINKNLIKPANFFVDKPKPTINQKTTRLQSEKIHYLENSHSNKKAMGQLQSFGSYGLMPATPKKPQQHKNEQKKMKVNFLYKTAKKYERIEISENPTKHHRNYTCPTLQTCSKMDDSKQTQVPFVEPESHIKLGLSTTELMRNQANNKFFDGKQSNYFSEYLGQKPSLKKSTEHLDDLSCIKAESIVNQSQFSEAHLSEVLQDSYSMKLKRYSSAEYFGYGLEEDQSGIGASRIYIN